MRMHQIGRIVVADAHSLERLGIAAVLRSVFHCNHLDFASGRGELDELLNAQPDLVLIDSEFPGFTASDIRQIRANFPSTRFVIVSSDCSPATVLTTIGCGVDGFIPKSLGHPEMIAAFRQIAAGYVYVPHVVADAPQLSPANESARSASVLRELTQRQQQVLELASDGKSNKEIGRQLDISEATVKVHLSAAFRALGVNNRLSAVALFRHWRDPQASLPLSH